MPFAGQNTRNLHIASQPVATGEPVNENPSLTSGKAKLKQKEEIDEKEELAEATGIAVEAEPKPVLTLAEALAVAGLTEDSPQNSEPTDPPTGFSFTDNPELVEAIFAGIDVARAMIGASENNWPIPYSNQQQPTDATKRPDDPNMKFNAPGGVEIKGTPNTIAAPNMSSVISTLLGVIAPIVSSYLSFILPIVGLIIGIMEILCCLMNPFCVIPAVKRFMRHWVPMVVSLIPPVASAPMIMSIIQVVMGIITFIMIEILPTITLLIENISGMIEAIRSFPSQKAKADGMKEKLYVIMTDLINRMGVLAILKPVFSLVFAILGMFVGLPCGPRSRAANLSLLLAPISDFGVCCGNTQCPEELKQENQPRGIADISQFVYGNVPVSSVWEIDILYEKIGKDAPLRVVYDAFRKGRFDIPKTVRMKYFQNLEEQLTAQLGDPVSLARSVGYVYDDLAYMRIHIKPSSWTDYPFDDLLVKDEYGRYIHPDHKLEKSTEISDENPSSGDSAAAAQAQGAQGTHSAVPIDADPPPSGAPSIDRLPPGHNDLDLAVLGRRVRWELLRDGDVGFIPIDGPEWSWLLIHLSTYGWQWWVILFYTIWIIINLRPKMTLIVLSDEIKNMNTSLIDFLLKPNYALLVGGNIIGVGCVPDVIAEREILSERYKGVEEPLGDAIPEMLTLEEDIFDPPEKIWIPGLENIRDLILQPIEDIASYVVLDADGNNITSSIPADEIPPVPNLPDAEDEEVPLEPDEEIPNVWQPPTPWEEVVGPEPEPEQLDGPRDSRGELLPPVPPSAPDGSVITTGEDYHIALVLDGWKTIEDSLIETADGLRNKFELLIGHMVDTISSTLEVDKNLVIAGAQDKAIVSVIPRSTGGAILTKGLIPGVNFDVTILTDFGTLRNQKLDKNTGIVTAELLSPIPGEANIMAKVNDEFVEDINVTTRTPSVERVRFIADDILPKRRLVSKPSPRTKARTNVSSGRGPRSK